MITHEEEAKNASGASYFSPDLPGKMSLKELHKQFDMMGRISYEGSTRYLDFNPSDNQIAKNAAGWSKMTLPDLHLEPNKDFLAKLIADAKSKLGGISAARAAVAKAVEEWKTLLTGCTLETLNTVAIAKLAALSPHDPIKPQAWALMLEAAKAHGRKFEKDKRVLSRTACRKLHLGRALPYRNRAGRTFPWIMAMIERRKRLRPFSTLSTWPGKTSTQANSRRCRHKSRLSHEQDRETTTHRR